MRFFAFVTLIVVAFALDLALLGLGLRQPEARLFQPYIAHAAAGERANATATPAPSPTPSPTPTATATPAPTATPTATAAPTATATPIVPTATPRPLPQLLAAHAVAFSPSDRGVRANIRLALSLYHGALTHRIIAPGAVFSFNALLGPRPQRLPWKYITLKPTEPPADQPDAPVAAPTSIQGGGLCDLASRFVMAARPLLPARAFRFVNHVRSNGIHLSGVPTRDSVSIWAVGGGPGEHDLKITNLSQGWLEFNVVRQGAKITVIARLWDRSPDESSP